MTEATVGDGGLRPAVALELLKPITWFPPIWAFGCGVVSASRPFHLESLPAILAGLVLVGPMVCGASQAVNDWFDRDVDALNEPTRAVPSGRAPGRTAFVFAIAWSALGLALGAILGPFVAIATALGLALAWAYSAPPLRLKANGWLGPATAALCYEGLAWLTGAAVSGGHTPGDRTAAMAGLYSVGAIGIMVLNDFKSVDGDRAMGLLSVPVLLGPRRAARAACAVMAAPQAVVVALLLAWDRWVEAAVVAALLAVQLALAPKLLKDPKGRAAWYNGAGVGPYVLGMMACALALRGL